MSKTVLAIIARRVIIGLMPFVCLYTTLEQTALYVLALVTWAIIKGGDIMNIDLFNPLNTSQSGSDLGGVQQSTGNMTYPSFDQGVGSSAAKQMVLNFAQWAHQKLGVAAPATTDHAGSP